MPESDDSPATSRMFLLGIVVWYNLVIWAAERAYAAMTRGARFQELTPTSWRPRRLTSTSDKKTKKNDATPRVCSKVH